MTRYREVAGQMESEKYQDPYQLLGEWELAKYEWIAEARGVANQEFHKVEDQNQFAMSIHMQNVENRFFAKISPSSPHWNSAYENYRERKRRESSSFGRGLAALATLGLSELATDQPKIDYLESDFSDLDLQILNNEIVIKENLQPKAFGSTFPKLSRIVHVDDSSLVIAAPVANRPHCYWLYHFKRK